MGTALETTTLVYRTFNFLEAQGIAGEAVVPGHEFSTGFRPPLTLFDPETKRPIGVIALQDADDQKEQRQLALRFQAELRQLQLRLPTYLFLLNAGPYSYPEIFQLSGSGWTGMSPEKFPTFAELKGLAARLRDDTSEANVSKIRVTFKWVWDHIASKVIVGTFVALILGAILVTLGLK